MTVFNLEDGVGGLIIIVRIACASAMTGCVLVTFKSSGKPSQQNASYVQLRLLDK